MSAVTVASCKAVALGTTLSHVRCPHPAAVERMKRSLAQHGQLAPATVVQRQGRLETVDGLKRRAALVAMDAEILYRVVELDETGQWVAMLQLNLCARSITALEEALVLRELTKQGLSQVDLAALLGRHKAWVSRRVGLVERLHPELLEQMKQGLLHPGVARALLGLPAGNQLELAAVAVKADLGSQQTERLVSLWQQAAAEPEVRRYLLAHPQHALAQAYPKSSPPPCDPRLTSSGQSLARLLHVFEEVTSRMLRLLAPAPPVQDLAILRPRLLASEELAAQLATALGSSASCADDAASGVSGATP